MSKWENNEEIQIFQEYLRIPSVHPNIDYEPCVKFLKRQADNIGLQFKVVYPVLKTKPVCIITYPGTVPEMPSILFNSHMDVVPVLRKNWTHDPFGAEIDEDGKIYARGSQDCKCIGMQYLAALRYFVSKKIQFKRTIHVIFVPDEEIGGFNGMKDFVHTEEFKNLNVGFELDEGSPGVGDKFIAYYAERSIWRIDFTIPGEPGHASVLLPNNAAVKLHKLMTKLLELRSNELSRLGGKYDDENWGTVTSLNITIINGGLQSNVIPSEFKMTVDFRVAVDVDHDKFIETIEKWCKESGDGITYKFEIREDKYPQTAIDDSNKYWMAFRKTFDELNMKLLPLMFGAASDARFIRSVGIPAIGFSPIIDTIATAHADDEFLGADVYLKGIEIYKRILTNLANCD